MTSSLWPVVRANSVPISLNTVAIARAVNTLTSSAPAVATCANETNSPRPTADGESRYIFIAASEGMAPAPIRKHRIRAATWHRSISRRCASQYRIEKGTPLEDGILHAPIPLVTKRPRFYHKLLAAR